MNKNFTPEEHWELHQGLWRVLGCDMELKHMNNNTVVYVDKITNRQYNYSALGYIEEKRYATLHIL